MSHHCGHGLCAPFRRLVYVDATTCLRGGRARLLCGFAALAKNRCCARWLNDRARRQRPAANGRGPWVDADALAIERAALAAARCRVLVAPLAAASALLRELLEARRALIRRQELGVLCARVAATASAHVARTLEGLARARRESADAARAGVAPRSGGDFYLI